MFRKLRRKIVRLAFVSGAGAAATYFFDRERGVERREQAKAKAGSLLGRRPAPPADWQSAHANGFEPPAPATATAPSAPAATATGPAPATATVTDITGITGVAEVDVLVAEPGPLSAP